MSKGYHSMTTGELWEAYLAWRDKQEAKKPQQKPKDNAADNQIIDGAGGDILRTRCRRDHQEDCANQGRYV